jgi:hypothetical protein
MDRSPSLAYFQVGCPCGERATFVLGHWLRGEESPCEEYFTGPLAVECPKCARISELMDPQRDGYDGEIGANTNAVGRGPRSQFPCPRCAGVTPMLTMAGFSYTALDEWSASDEELERPQDFFHGFWLYGGCTQCREVSRILGFECS